VKDLAKVYRKLGKMEWKALDTIFRKIWEYKYVPSDFISKKLGIDEDTTIKILKVLGSERLVENRIVSYYGSNLTFFGMSVYSLRRLVKRGKIDMIGQRMGEGKESVIYNCYSEKYGECVIKFHKLGGFFRKVREKRDYGDLHLTVLTVRSAGREYKALRRLFGSVSVPEPFGWEGNAVLMELIEGRELFKIKVQNPEDVLEMIINETRRMLNSGIVHGDLSQHNVLVGDEIYLIDFPQHIEIERHEDWEDYLKRDLNNILRYFQKVYGIEKDINSVIDYVMSR
jgi:RIO kinase 2